MKTNFLIRILTFLCGASYITGGLTVAADWPQFLGPNRDGISAETGLMVEWPAAGPKELWRTKGGVGQAGIAVSRGRLFTLVQDSGQQQLLALDAQTGQSVWKTNLAPEYKNQQGDGPRATPTVANDLILAYTGEGILTAVNVETGKPVWSHNVVADLKGKIADYGMASSPLVVGDLVIVTVGAPQATVAAYRLKTGEQVWKTGKEDPAGYSSPALLEIGGRKQVIVFTGASLLGLVPETGVLLWRYPFETDYDCNIAVPLAVDGKLFISAGENHGSFLLNLKPQGEQFAVVEVWKSEGTGSVMRNEWQTSILLDGHLYGLDNIGSAGPVTHLTCVEAATGKRLWQQPRFGKGNLTAADGKLFFSTMTGDLIVAKASPTGYQELGRKPLLGPTRQAPAISNGLLYLRDDREILCLDIRAAK